MTTIQGVGVRTLQYDAQPGDLLVIPESIDPIESGSTFTVDDKTADRLLADTQVSVLEIKTETAPSGKVTNTNKEA